MQFFDRRDAGKKLAGLLNDYENRPGVIVIGLPRGGVIVAAEVAKALNQPLDVITAKKLGAPGDPELAIGAVVDGMQIIDRMVIRRLGIAERYLKQETERKEREVKRRQELYRAGQKPLDLHRQIVIIVDDGIATGATMEAAIQFARNQVPREIVVAVPAGSESTCAALRQKADRVECFTKPKFFGAVGEFYKEFPEVEDGEVIEALALAQQRIQATDVKKITESGEDQASHATG